MYWWDNPLQTWQRVKEAVLAGEPVRVWIGWKYDQVPGYAGYLFRLSGDRVAVVKFGKAKRVISWAELMGLCLGGRLWIDTLVDMPDYYQKFA